MSTIMFKFADAQKVKQEERLLIEQGYDYMDVLNDLNFEALFGYPLQGTNPARLKALNNLAIKMAPKGYTLPASNWIGE